MQETLRDDVAELTAALKPRLRGVLHEAAFAISLVTGTALVALAEGASTRAAADVPNSSATLTA